MMTDFTDEDVQRGARAMHGAEGCDCNGRFYADEVPVRAILAAVLPAHDAALRLRWEEDEAAGGLPLVEHDRELILALADELAALGQWWTAEWLTRKAEGVK